MGITEVPVWVIGILSILCPLTLQVDPGSKVRAMMNDGQHGSQKGDPMQTGSSLNRSPHETLNPRP